MKQLLTVIITFFLFGCSKSVNTLDDPSYKMMTAHSWQSDSTSEILNGTSTVMLSTADQYEVLAFTFPTCQFSTYTVAGISSSAYSFDYRQQRIDFFPLEGGSTLNYSDIKTVTDSRLVLEHHTPTDSSSPVITTYYHAR